MRGSLERTKVGRHWSLLQNDGVRLVVGVGLQRIPATQEAEGGLNVPGLRGNKVRDIAVWDTWSDLHLSPN